MRASYNARNNPQDYGIGRNLGSGLRDWRTLLGTLNYVPLFAMALKKLLWRLVNNKITTYANKFPKAASHFPTGARVSSQTGYYYETNANLTEPRRSLINNLEISNDRQENALCLARDFTESRFLARGPVIRTRVIRLVLQQRLYSPKQALRKQTFPALITG